MNLLMQPAFWALAVGMATLLRTDLSIRRTLFFGVLNLGCLAVLCGVKGAALALGLATSIWGGLQVTSRGSGSGTSTRSPYGMVAALTAAFCGYRLVRGGSTGVLELLGYSYVYLRAVDAVVAVARDRQALLDPVSLCGYLAPFHALAAGPVCAYREHLTMDGAAPPDHSFEATVRDVDVITSGLFRKFVIAEGLRICAVGVRGRLETGTFLETALLLVYVLFDFSGYSMVALGVGRMCGVPTPPNFHAPFAATSVTEFWVRWHASMGAFVRRNVYLPLQLALVRAVGVRRSWLASPLSLAVAFGFVGLWHRFTLPWLGWGLSLAAIMWIEKMVRDAVLGNPALAWARGRSGMALARVLGPVYVLVAVVAALRLVARDLV